MGFQIDGTRPTTSRVRESLIATITPYLKNAKVLDLFAGSGALGIEALSNGASSCVFVENNKKMFNSLNQNLAKINEDYQVFNIDFKKIKGNFDIIFLDPPYNLGFLNQSINHIKKYRLLNKCGIIIVEYEKEEFSYEGFELLKLKKYGNKKIMILKKMEVDDDGKSTNC